MSRIQYMPSIRKTARTLIPLKTAGVPSKSRYRRPNAWCCGRVANNRPAHKEERIKQQRTPLGPHTTHSSNSNNARSSIMEDSTSIALDPSGDLQLTTDTLSFVVSSKAMCLASPVWRAMLDPQGPWAKQSSSSSPSSGLSSHAMLEDDPDALLILLRIAHLRFSELPDVLNDYQHLLQLAVLCDK